MPKWLWWVIGFIAIIWIVNNPSGAGHTVNELITGIFTFGSSVSR